MKSVACAASRALFSACPEFASQPTYAEQPVWTGSAKLPVKWHRIDRKQAAEIWREARRMNQPRRGKGLGGVIGPAAMAVLQSLLFDFLNYRTGQLDPSYEGLAKKTGLSRATVARALKRLRELRIINWVRRCAEYIEDGRYIVEQQRNAYAVLAPTGWQGFVARVVNLVLPHEWGKAPVMPSLQEQAAELHKTAGWAAARKVYHEADDPLMKALARLGDAVQARRS